ncbi:MAG: glycosyltransferase family 39 protein [Chitinophagales bacterium]
MAKQKPEIKQAAPPKAVIKQQAGPAFFAANPARLYMLIIFLLGFVLYSNTIPNEYNLDDELVVQTQVPNRDFASGWQVTSPHRLTSKGWEAIKFNFDAFGADSLNGAGFGKHLKYFLPEVFREPYYKDKAGYQYEFRPVVLFSFALEHAVFASKENQNGQEVEVENPHLIHFFNVLFYALLCVLLFIVLRRLFAQYNPLFAFFITLLFTAHPIHTEVVASIKNRDEIFALGFGLLSVYSALRFVESSKFKWLLIVPLAFVLGILSKSTTITFVLLLPLAVVLLTQATFRQVLLLAVVLIVPSIFFSRLYSVTQQIIFTLALFSAIAGLFVLRHFPSIKAGLQGLIKNASDTFHSRTQSEITTDYQLNFAFLRNPLVGGSFVLLLLAGAGLAFAGLYTANVWLACLPVLLFCVVFLMVRAELQCLLITPIALLITYSMVRFNSTGVLVQAGLMVFLTTQFFSGNRQVKTVAIVNYVIYALASFIFLHSFFPLAVFFFAGFLNRRLLPLTYIMIAVSLVFVGRSVFMLATGKSGFELGLLGLPLIFASVFLLWRSKQHVLLRTSLLALPLIMLLYFRFAPPSSATNIVSGIQHTYTQMNVTRAADLNPVQSVRPVYYIENPIKPTDPFSVKFGTAMTVLGKYLKQVFVPYPMSYYYGFSYFKPVSISNTVPIAVLVAYILISLLAVAFIWRQPVISFSIFFYLGSIAVFSNLFIPVPGVMGDRFLLIPSIGFCVLVVFLCFKGFGVKPEEKSLTLKSVSKGLAGVFLTLTLVYSLLAFVRNRDWKDRITLFSHDIEVVGNSAQAQNLLGVHLFLLSQQKEYQSADSLGARIQLLEKAASHFNRAIEIYPPFLNATYDLGRAYYTIGNFYSGYYHNTQQARIYFDKAFDKYREAQKIDTGFVTPSFEMGVIMDGRDSLEQAIYWYEHFLTKIKTQKEAYANLSYAYFRLKRYDESINTNKRALLAIPNAYEPTVNIAKTYHQMQQMDSAIIYYEKSYLLNQKDVNLVKVIYKISADRNDTRRLQIYGLKLKEMGVKDL